jgi:hypothetical protein
MIASGDTGHVTLSSKDGKNNKTLGWQIHSKNQIPITFKSVIYN